MPSYLFQVQSTKQSHIPLAIQATRKLQNGDSVTGIKGMYCTIKQTAHVIYALPHTLEYNVE